MSAHSALAYRLFFIMSDCYPVIKRKAWQRLSSHYSSLDGAVSLLVDGSFYVANEPIASTTVACALARYPSSGLLASWVCHFDCHTYALVHLLRCLLSFPYQLVPPCADSSRERLPRGGELELVQPLASGHMYAGMEGEEGGKEEI